jgi:hypothetical protein
LRRSGCRLLDLRRFALSIHAPADGLTPSAACATLRGYVRSMRSRVESPWAWPLEHLGARRSTRSAQSCEATVSRARHQRPARTAGGASHTTQPEPNCWQNRGAAADRTSESRDSATCYANGWRRRLTRSSARTWLHCTTRMRITKRGCAQRIACWTGCTGDHGKASS